MLFWFQGVTDHEHNIYYMATWSIKYTVPHLLTDHFETQGLSLDDQGVWMVRILGVGDPTSLKKTQYSGL